MVSNGTQRKAAHSNRVGVLGRLGVVRCRGPIGAVAPTPVPVPVPVPPLPTPAGTKLKPAAFAVAFGPSARASQAKHGVPALVTLGQAALESGWGRSAPRFNFFGIKAKASDPESMRQLMKTREVSRSDFSDAARRRQV